MIYAFYGEDRFRAREALAELRRELDADGTLAQNTLRIEGRGLSAAELRAACHTASLFAERRLVIVEGLQERFSGARHRSRSGARASGARSRAGDDLEAFIDVLSSLPPSTTVVLLDEEPSAVLLEGLGAAVTAREFRPLRGAELRQWAEARAAGAGADFAPAAMERLLSLVDGFHLGELAQEIDKLATYAAGRRIEAADVDELTSGALQYRVWDLTDAAIEGRGERALAVLRAMDARDHPPQLLLFMLTRQYRQLLLAQALRREGLSAAEIGERLAVRGFPLRKLMDLAGRYPADGLEAAYRRLLETDVAVKRGVLEVGTALELLVTELAALGRREGAAPRVRL